VFGLHPGDRRKRFRPACACLSGQREHEIHVDIPNAGIAKLLVTHFEILEAVDAAELLQLVTVD
jgi:hypothetical protein